MRCPEIRYDERGRAVGQCLRNCWHFGPHEGPNLGGYFSGELSWFVRQSSGPQAGLFGAALGVLLSLVIGLTVWALT